MADLDEVIEELVRAYYRGPLSMTDADHMKAFRVVQAWCQGHRVKEDAIISEETFGRGSGGC